MLIILEGPDGGGKSHLAAQLEAAAKQLREKFKRVECRHHGAYLNQESIAINYLAAMKPHGRQDDVLRIWDRSWLSEVIYGQQMRGGLDRVGPARARMLERVALSLGAVVVVCLPPYEVCLGHWRRRRGEEYLDDDSKLRGCYAAYGHLTTALPVIYYDHTAANNGGDAQLLAEFMAAASPASRGGSDGIGSWRPDSVVLLGDRVSRYGLGQLPFVSFHQGGCSNWLAEQLSAAGIGEERLYWLNSCGLTTRWLDQPGRPEKVVALGNMAARWCQRAGLDHATAPHPQYWKRFHHRAVYPLISTLKELLA